MQTLKMKRETTINKSKLVIELFQELLRSGKDLTANSMYEDAGAKYFLGEIAAGTIIRDHYKNNVITQEMIDYGHEIKGNKQKVIVSLFAQRFNLCKREARYILRFIWFKE